MLTRRGWLLVIICLSGMAGCQQEEANPVEETRQKLTGRWDWVQTEYPARALSELTVETPANTQKRQMLEFRTNQTLLYWRNDTLQGTYPFTINQVAGGEFWLKIEGQIPLIPSGNTPFTINQDQLLLQANYNDFGGNSTFSKQE